MSTLYNNGEPLQIGGSSMDDKIIVPSKLFAVVGFEFNVYWDTIVFCPPYGANTPDLFIEAVCTKGKNTERCFRFTPTASDVGEYDITFQRFNDKREKVAEKKSKLIVINPSALTIPTTHVMHIGDSTVDDTCKMMDVLYNENLKGLNISSIIPIGTRSSYSGARHEAHTGNRYVSYKSKYTCAKMYVSNLQAIIDGMNETHNTPHPSFTTSTGATISFGYVNTKEGWVTIANNALSNGFSGTITKRYSFYTFPDAVVTNVINNVEINVLHNSSYNIDFNHYLSNWYDGNLSKIDMLVLACGVNDSRGAENKTQSVDVPIATIKEFITAFLTHNPNGKVIVNIPKIMVSTVLDSNTIGYNVNSYNLRNAIIDEFDNFKYSDKVYVLAECCGMDRYWGYVNKETDMAKRITSVKIKGHDSVHPNNEGYAQIADTYLGALLYVASR